MYAVLIYSGIKTNVRVFNRELYTHLIQKLNFQHLFAEEVTAIYCDK